MSDADSSRETPVAPVRRKGSVPALIGALLVAGILSFTLMTDTTLQGNSTSGVRCHGLLQGSVDGLLAQTFGGTATASEELKQLDQDAEVMCERRERQQLLYAVMLMPLIYFLGRRGLPGDPL